ncbi:DUF2306 domain-containing protein [Ktedonobacter racemifer]|uniref:Membrane protein (DUF2306) n=1 Tax=Ktedonobacter racemifer DSM 44963 TaxID=485913 RepID=D6TGN0_KTERA|nr:DUF2306 domain-containing protein [Ktedonobacter racemifer]EFH90742.1 Protein of unknown function DUF2306, membrane [Ktedonobacter racemifer DSM 44963]
MKSLARQLSWGLMALLSIAIAIVFAGPYLSFNPAVSRVGLNPAIPIHFVVLAIHAGTAGIALLIGPFQFLTRLRARYPLAHRTIGRIYLICIFIGSVFAFFSALFSVSGFVAQVGFAFLATIWFYSASKAYRAIRQRQIQLHRVWMIRNYALTFAAVILRLWLLLGQYALHLPFTDVYVTSAWISWILPLVVAEWFINQRLLQSLALKKDRASSLQQEIRV